MKAANPFRANWLIRTIGLSMFIAADLTAPGCGGGGGGNSNNPPTSANCPNLGGTYVGSFSNGCGQPTDSKVVIEQIGCHLSSSFTGLGSVHGNIDAFGVWTFDIFPVPPCGGTISGTTYPGTPISGTYSGSLTGTGCCGTVNETFTLTKQ